MVTGELVPPNIGLDAFQISSSKALSLCSLNEGKKQQVVSEELIELQGN